MCPLTTTDDDQAERNATLGKEETRAKTPTNDQRSGAGGGGAADLAPRMRGGLRVEERAHRGRPAPARGAQPTNGWCLVYFLLMRRHTQFSVTFRPRRGRPRRRGKGRPSPQHARGMRVGAEGEADPRRRQQAARTIFPWQGKDPDHGRDMWEDCTFFSTSPTFFLLHPVFPHSLSAAA